MELQKHYSGTFEAFRVNGEQFARLTFPDQSFNWFKFDYFKETYHCNDPEMVELLEKSYQKKFLQK
jgi:hypothetical protein